MKENKKGSHKKRKINVLQLVEGFSLGGAEKKLLELVKCMDQTSFNTTICSLGLGDEIQEEFEKLSELGINVMVLPRKRRIDFGLFFRIVRLIRTLDIDVIMTTLFYADVIGPLAGKFAGVKAIFSWETISAPEWLIMRRLWPYMFAIRFCNRVISVSRATAQFLVEKRGVPSNRIMIIPYGVDLSKYHIGTEKGILKQLGIRKKDPVIGMVGRLHPQKGHQYLVEAAKDIVLKYPNTRFLIIGDGKLRNELEKKVKAEHLEDNILFLGFRDDVAELLRAVDIFTLPSLYEGLPNVALEAMACGKPVVATPADGSKEAVIDGETGLLVPMKDSRRLCEALSYFIENPEIAREFGRRGRKRVEKEFSLETQIKRFEDLYRSYVIK